MKKLQLTILIVATMISCGCVFAQDNVTDSMQMRVDSLENAVRFLQSNVQQAQEKPKSRKAGWGRPRFFYLGYATQTLTPEFGEKFKSQFGMNVAMGRSIYLHKKPLAGMVRFAIDLGGEFNYAKYKSADLSDLMAGLEEDGDNNGGGYDDGSLGGNGTYEDEEDMEVKFGVHQAEIAFLLGPTVAVNPIDDLIVRGYFRFAPSYSMILNDDELSSKYVSFFTYGVEASWRVIGLGVEGRFGKAKYGSLFSSGDGEEEVPPMKYSTKAFRVFLSLRF